MTTQFHNTSTENLADEIGRLNNIIKISEERLDTLKEEFRSRGVNTVRGTDYIVSASTSVTRRLDTKRLQADLGEALEDYYNENEVTRVLIRDLPRLVEAAE